MSFMKKIWILFFLSFLIIACKNNSYEVSKINAKQLKIVNEVKQDSSIIQLFTPYINQYNAGGNIALIDGMLGTEDYRTGT